MTERDAAKIGAALIAAAETDEFPFLGWKEVSDSHKRLALITALKAGNVPFADVIGGPLSPDLRTEANVDLTVADALEVFATQSAPEVCGCVIDRVDDVISALISSLQTRGGDLRARRSYMETLGNLGEHAKDAVPTLTECLKDSDVRIPARLALGNLGEHAKDAVPALTEYLKDSDWHVRSSAARALGNIGKKDVSSRKRSRPWL